MNPESEPPHHAPLETDGRDKKPKFAIVEKKWESQNEDFIPRVVELLAKLFWAYGFFVVWGLAYVFLHFVLGMRHDWARGFGMISGAIGFVVAVFLAIRRQFKG